MPNSPLPTHWKTNPVGQVDRYRKAANRLKRPIKDATTWLIERFNQIPYNTIEVNSAVGGYVVNTTNYEYLIDIPELEAIVAELMLRLGEIDEDEFWDAVLLAYQEGTASQVAAMTAMTPAYTRTLAEVLTSNPWLRRVALIEGRVFELMEGFEGDVGRDLSRVLRTAVQEGVNPREVAKTIRQRYGVSANRADRIARTEITTAYRRARLDEAVDAEERLEIHTREMHLSALLPTTRAHHAARHGKLYTAQECRNWWATGANSINCRCSTVSVLTDEDGNPLDDGVIKRARAMK